MKIEWALVLFTITAQASAGLFIVMMILRAVAVRRADPKQGEALIKKPITFGAPLVVIAMFLSLLHLASPLRAPFSILNIASSWLSREILFTCLFALVWLITVIFTWKKIGSYALRSIIGWIGAAFAVALVICMSEVYMLAAQPAWNTVFTPIIFLSSALTLGSALALLLINKHDYGSARISAIIMVVAAIAASAGIALRYVTLKGSSVAEAAASAEIIKSDYLIFFIGAIVILVIGIVLSIFIYRMLKKDKFSTLSASTVLVLFTAALILDRILFYAVHVKIGIL